MKKSVKEKRGFTLIELLIVIVILGIILFFLTGIIKKGIDAWYFVIDRAELMNQAHYALNRMLRELRQIKDKKSIYYATSSTLTFQDTEDNFITYSCSGNILYRNDKILLDGVTNFSLQYFNINDTIILNPKVNPNTTDIYKIKVSISLQKGDYPLYMRTAIKPRNF